MKTKNFSSLRIISGKWGSRKVHFPNDVGIRPTQDRIRETLFNWLDPYIVGANCLDLFSGTGSFSFESLSRGAKHVTCVEIDATIISSLRENAQTLEATHIDIVQGDSLSVLVNLSHQYDVVFLDPPFSQGLLLTGFSKLIENNILASEARIYFECERGLNLNEIGEGLKVIKYKKTKGIQYGMAQFCKA